MRTVECGAGTLNIGEMFLGLTHNPARHRCKCGMVCPLGMAHCNGMAPDGKGGRKACGCALVGADLLPERRVVHGLQLSITAKKIIKCVEGSVQIKDQVYPLLLNSRKQEDIGKLVECSHDLGVPVGKTVWVNVMFTQTGVPADEFLKEYIPLTLDLQVNGKPFEIPFEMGEARQVIDTWFEQAAPPPEDSIYA